LARGSLVVAAAVLLYYSLTMARDLSFYDSAELAMVAVQGGVGHPLGQPVHTMLGWLVSHLPGVPALVALNFLSALFTALAVVPVVFLLGELAGPDRPDAPVWAQRRALVPAAVGITWLHPAVWENGTRVEVYALGLFFCVWAAAWLSALLSRVGPRSVGPSAGARPRGHRWFVGGLLLGLAGAVNGFQATVVALALAPASLLALWSGLHGSAPPRDRGQARARFGLREAGLVVLGGLVGLLPYVYVFAAAHRTDVFVWGAPTGGDLLLRYLKGSDFANNRHLGWGDLLSHLAGWLGWAWHHGYAAPIAVGLGVHLASGSRLGAGRVFAPLVFVCTLVVLCANGIFFPDIADYQGYLSLPVGLLIGAAMVWGARLATGLRAPRPWLWRLSGGAVLASVTWLVVSAPPALWLRSRHRDRLARVLAQGALDDAPPRAVVIADSDHWVFPLLYLQEAEGRRPDVVLLPLGLSGASWYWAHLYRRHPDLTRVRLRGPGGRVGRVKRFLAANSRRPVLYESYALAAVLGTPGCPGRWLLRDRNACGYPGGLGPDWLTGALERQVDRLGPGAPTARRVIARVAFERAEVLWRYGLPRQAMRAARAGVFQALRPLSPQEHVDAAGRLGPGPLSPPCRRVLIGTEARNLWLGAQILLRSAHPKAAATYLRAATRAGCR